MKKTWVKVKRGLLEPKHRMELGVRIWLYLYILDRTNWETGKVLDWNDQAEADALEMPLATLRLQRRQLEESGYIGTRRKGNGLVVSVVNWTNPREYSGQVYNAGDKKLSPPKKEEIGVSDNKSDSESDRKSVRKVNTPTFNSQVTNHNNKAKSKKDTFRAIAEKYFKEKTKLPIPKSRSEAAALWWTPLRELSELAEWDAERLHLIIDKSLKRMEGLTVSSPKSILKTAYAIIGELEGGSISRGQGPVTDAEWRRQNFGGGQ